MTQIDLREALNAISDVVVNRPPPLREFDQIYMKAADMLLQAEHLSKWLAGKNAIFIGDGDAIGLCVMHLHAQGLFPQGPKSIHVIDFDERVINSVTEFSRKYGLEGIVSAELYNVANPLPVHLWQRYEAFYANPPFGSRNLGKSVEAFLRRGFEATSSNATACIVVADDPNLEWPLTVLMRTQKVLLDSGFVIVEMVPGFHRYHLDDAPDLSSCSLIARRIDFQALPYSSLPLDETYFDKFYGEQTPLRVGYIHDLRQGGKLPSHDYQIELLK